MRKIITIILCISILLSSSLVSMAYTPQDSVKILRSLGVIQGDPNGDLRENDLVKRSEFSKMAVLLSEYKNKLSLNSKISVFTDCTAEHWAAPYVRVAAENGIIEGYSNGLFGPDDCISYAQAVTIALRLLGYTDADFGYTYPEGQLGMAQSLKLGDGLFKEADDLLSRLDVAIIFKNMLLTNKKGTNTNYIESLDYKIKEDTVIVATNDEESSVAPGKVFTTSGEYTIDNSFDKSLIGYKGSAIVDSEGKLLTLIKTPGSAVRYSVTTAGSDFVSLTGAKGNLALDCDDGTLSYIGTQKTNFASLKTSVSVGDVVIVGKDGNGNIDYLISVKSDLDGPYTVNEDEKIPLDIDYSSYSVIKNGSTSSVLEIKKNDIIYVSSSLKTVFVYNKKVSGTYTAASPNMDSPETVTVGSKEYKIESPLAFSKLSTGGYTKGDSVVLLLGRDGGVADVLGNKTIPQESTAENIKLQENAAESSYALLISLGAIDNPDNGTSPATRGEFAKMAVMSSGYRNSVSTLSKLSVFVDCTASHPMSPYIKIAAENKFMSAYSNSLFCPEKAVTYAEALDASLRILGYSDSDFSDWPSSQISIAKQKGITNGINKSAYDELTKDEAVLIIYNTLKATNKQGSVKGIEQIGYSYYDDAVIIATNNESTSVGAGKLLTSEGTFAIDENSFDASDVGKTGELLVYSGKVQMFNKTPYPYTESVIISAVPGGLLLSAQKGTSSVSVPDAIAVYMGAEKTSFARAASSIAVGDTAYICYDKANRIKYIHINSSSLKGPFRVISPSGWYAQISGASSSSKIMKNGMEILASSLLENDILYYSPELNTAYAYNNKVIGILEGASPSKDAPEKITVSGTSYTLESADVSFVNTAYGDMVVLCLGRNGKVAYSYRGENETIAGYLVGTGSKQFTNQNGDSYTSKYASIILPDGTKVDCATDSDYSSWINRVMSVKLSGGKAKLSPIASPGKLSGTFNAEKLTLGSSKISSDVKILDVGFNQADDPSVYKSIYMQRLDGISISSSDILYEKSENGMITELILKDVTGDAFSYGVIVSASSSITKNSSSGSYTVDVAGSRYSYSGGAFTGIAKGNMVKTAISGGRADNFTRLANRMVSLKDASHGSITLKDGTEYLLSDEVVVYRLTGIYDYNVISLSEFVENWESYSSVSIFTDKAISRGGRVRVITVK